MDTHAYHPSTMDYPYPGMERGELKEQVVKVLDIRLKIETVQMDRD